MVEIDEKYEWVTYCLGYVDAVEPEDIAEQEYIRAALNRLNRTTHSILEAIVAPR